MTTHPSMKAVNFDHLAEEYGAVDFVFCLCEFIVRFNNPNISRAQLNWLLANYQLQFNTVAVYHKAKFWESDFSLYRHASDEYNVIHATPARTNTRQQLIPSRFDTALICESGGGRLGIDGTWQLLPVQCVIWLLCRVSCCVGAGNIHSTKTLCFHCFHPCSNSPTILCVCWMVFAVSATTRRP